MRRSDPIIVGRRSALLASLTLWLVAGLSTGHAWAQSEKADTEADSIGASTATPRVSPFDKDRVDLAVDKAVSFLVSKQRKDGAILDGSYDTTMSALSIMAMASVGVQPGDPSPDGRAMQEALKFVLER